MVMVMLIRLIRLSRVGCSGEVWPPWELCFSVGVAFGGLFPVRPVLLGVVRWVVCSFLLKLALGGVCCLLSLLGASPAAASGLGRVSLFRVLVSVGQVAFASTLRQGRFLYPFAAGSGLALSQADSAAALRVFCLLCIRYVVPSTAWLRRLLVGPSDSASSPLAAAAIVLAWCLFDFTANLTSRFSASARFVGTSTARLRRFLAEPPDAHGRPGFRLTVVT